MTVRIVTTASSVWAIDETHKEFNRAPRVEGFENVVAPYTDDWHKYVSYEEQGQANGTFRLYFKLDNDPEYGNFIVSGPIEPEPKPSFKDKLRSISFQPRGSSG